MKKRGIVFIGLGLVLLILAGLVAVVATRSNQPVTVTVTATTLPAAKVAQGENTVFRFTVSTSRDVRIENLVGKIVPGTGKVSIDNLRWYDESNGSEIVVAEVTTHLTETLIVTWPIENLKLKADRKNTKIISLRGNVKGEGSVFLRLEKLTVENGDGIRIDGLPSAMIMLEVR